MLFAAVTALALSLSVYEVHYSDGREGKDSEFVQSSNEPNGDTEEEVARTSDSVEEHSEENQTKIDSTASQEDDLEKQEEDKAPIEDELDYLAIYGSVLDDAGQPVPGATVVAEPASNLPTENSARVVSTGRQTRTTNDVGGFEFQDLEEGEYDLMASKGEEFFPAHLKVRTGMANAELVLQRLRAVRVYGQISDDFGAPLGEVTIRTLGTQFDVKSAEDGSYEIVTAPMRAGTPPVLNFRREGFKETRRRIEAVLGSDIDEVELDVQMEPESDGQKVAVAGQVLGPLGEAVVGARIQLKSSKIKKSYSTRTDGSGEFNIAEAEVSEGYMLAVMATEDYEAYQSEVFSVGPADLFFEIELEAAKFSSLSGTVSDLYGKPLSEFQLWLRGIGTSAQSPVAVRTDAAGQFRLEQLRAGEVALETRSRPTLRASNIVLEPRGHQDVHIFLDSGSGWLLGRVIDPQGEPVSGASVIMQWEARFGEVLSESRRDTRTDLQGHFTVSNLGAEDYSLTVQAPGYQTFRGQVQLSSAEEELEVQLTPTGASGG